MKKYQRMIQWLVFVSLIGLAMPALVGAQQRAVIGKKYWTVGKNQQLEREVGEVVQWIIVESDEKNLYYDLRLPSGNANTIMKTWLDKMIADGHLVDYDPEQKTKAEAESRRKAEAGAAARRIKLINSKNWPKDIKEAVINRKVELGMTAEQVTLAWGRPGRINRTVGSWGRHEQWVYGSTYVYLENDRVTSFQDSR
jgi:hypothetical protein